MDPTLPGHTILCVLLGGDVPCDCEDITDSAREEEAPGPLTRAAEKATRTSLWIEPPYLRPASK